MGRSTTVKTTTTPWRTRTYLGKTSINFRVRWSVRTSSSIACGSKICPARVLSCGNFEISTVSFPSIRTSTMRSSCSVSSPVGGSCSTTVDCAKTSSETVRKVSNPLMQSNRPITMNVVMREAPEVHSLDIQVFGIGDMAQSISQS